MFSFHKPKVYRSSQGCCICKAKSSSSRFTDSKKYEMDFRACFQLHEERRGEICNACVLLVKRFKRLPQGHRRHWSHVSIEIDTNPTQTLRNCFFFSNMNGIFLAKNKTKNRLLTHALGRESNR